MNNNTKIFLILQLLLPLSIKAMDSDPIPKDIKHCILLQLINIKGNKNVLNHNDELRQCIVTLHNVSVVNNEFHNIVQNEAFTNQAIIQISNNFELDPIKTAIILQTNGSLRWLKEQTENDAMVVTIMEFITEYMEPKNDVLMKHVDNDNWYLAVQQILAYRMIRNNQSKKWAQNNISKHYLQEYFDVALQKGDQDLIDDIICLGTDFSIKHAKRARECGHEPLAKYLKLAAFI